MKASIDQLVDKARTAGQALLPGDEAASSPGGPVPQVDEHSATPRLFRRDKPPARATGGAGGSRSRRRNRICRRAGDTTPANSAAPSGIALGRPAGGTKSRRAMRSSPKTVDEKPPGSGMSSAELPGGPGVHGLARSRRWTPSPWPRLQRLLTGDSVSFVALPDGTLVVDEDEPDESLAPLADAIEAPLRPPYRAELCARARSRWSVGAVRITVVEARGPRRRGGGA